MESCEARRWSGAKAPACNSGVVNMGAGVFRIGGPDKKLHTPHVCMLLWWEQLGFRVEMGDDRLQPVATRRAAFYVRCRADMCEGARSGHHAGLAYSSTGLMNCL